MKYAENITLLAFLAAAVYLLVVSICVINRMSKATCHSIRFAVIMVGALGAWSLMRAMFEPGFEPAFNLNHLATVLVCAVILVVTPRIPT